ncbi:MAG: hypothetical protein KBD01_13810 [Acidobacteria bacterium]|nr:hypothetical protein [Acidobacteriota bacterium]
MIRVDEAQFDLRLIRARPRSGWPSEEAFAENAVEAIVTARSRGVEGRASLALDGQWDDLDEVAFIQQLGQEFENLRAEALADLQARSAR